MNAFLPARAPAPAAVGRPAAHRRRVAALSVATLMVAGLVWSTPAELATTITASPDRTPLTSAPDPDVGSPHDIKHNQAMRSAPFPRPRALAPSPPADRRDAPDPTVLADRGRYVLYSTQVGLQNIPVATSRDMRHWSQPSDALPQLPDWATWGAPGPPA